MFLSLAISMSIVALITIYGTFQNGRSNWFSANWLYLLFDLLIFLSATYVLNFEKKIARSFPLNFILLAVFSVTLGLLLGSLSFMAQNFLILTCVCAITTVLITITAYTWVLTSEFNPNVALCCSLIVQLVIGVIVFSKYDILVIEMIVWTIISLFFTIMVVFGSKLMIEREGHTFSVDDYILAGMRLNLYFVEITIGIFLIALGIWFEFV